ncbi:MAG: DUF5060 domain-containing protein [Kiritimatiellae bacterium]|jgi:hypothetical protein|nr:DUF5060 domain-containing protein [Kiritimatiellia bacterium]
MLEKIRNCTLISFSVLLISSGIATAESVPLTVFTQNKTKPVALPYTQTLNFPGEHNFNLLPADIKKWAEADSISINLLWPADAPEHTGTLTWLKDRNHYWHQRIYPEAMKPGITNLIEIPFNSESTGWNTPGHSLAWHHRILLNPESVGFRVFSDTAYTGKCVLVSATLNTKIPKDTPEISNVRVLTKQIIVQSLYEIRFDLPDRYSNPFDPKEIDVQAQIITPANTTNIINGFYYHSHYRLEDELGKPVEPDGRPEWRVRYCPRQPGKYRMSLIAKDKYGTTKQPATLEFIAKPASKAAHKFIKVSEKDPRYFEFTDGSLYYPIGHNVRSATDARMDDKFPWKFRPEEGTTAYRRYFKRMEENGQNWAEVWMSAWSLGLEWTEGISGYHGANDYHMGNAWELDRVLDLAAQHSIYINLVFNYHGRISTWCDPEWQLHPYNKATPGGWLTMPLEFFSDPKAIEMQKYFIRYTQARWGWSPSIFGYELCSELNLTGHETHHKTHFEPSVVEWCRTLGKYIKQIDPYRHLVSAHISNDYKFLNPKICEMPEMDFNALDAYHHTNPEAIIPLMSKTALANTYNKPILITEFGGSPMAAGLEHLMVEQHAAIWTGVCVPLSGTPMFWWWQVIDENNLYPRYKALAKFMADVDPRDITAQQVETKLDLSNKKTGDKKLLKQFAAVCTTSPTKGRGYIYPKVFAKKGKEELEAKGLTLYVQGVQNAIYRVSFYETEGGEQTRKFDVRSDGDYIAIPVPTFKKDCAFKLRCITPVVKKR